MKTNYPLNFLVLSSMMIVIYVFDFFLLQHNFLHGTILTKLDNSTLSEVKKHILIHGLIPIYIALIILSASLIGAYLGRLLHHVFAPPKKKALLSENIAVKNLAVRK